MLPTTATRPASWPANIFFRPIQLRRPQPRPGTSSQEDPAGVEDKGLFCWACAAHITDHDQSIRINGRHQHAFFNPAGIAFELRCFQTAPGVLSYDTPSKDFSWFPGFSWQVALCRGCQAHLGWRFVSDSANDEFYGLIVSRLLSR